MTISNITNGFKKCGVHPFNPDDIKIPSSVPSSDDYNGGNEQPEGSDLFSSEENALYKQRFEEGFDMFDARYNEWLAIHHPEAVVCEDNALYPHFDDHELTGMDEDFEYMLSLAMLTISVLPQKVLLSQVVVKLPRLGLLTVSLFQQVVVSLL